jgi:hypothetical protein
MGFTSWHNEILHEPVAEPHVQAEVVERSLHKKDSLEGGKHTMAAKSAQREQ